MRVEQILLQDFKSYRCEAVDFSGISLASVIGPNGAGKSSLLEAIVFAFTGARGIRNLDSFIRQGAEECRVSLTFTMTGERYKVTRTRSSRGGGKSTVELARQDEGAWVAEGSGARETDQRIAEILAVDEEILLLTSIVTQGDAGSFFALQPAKRLEAFASILSLDEQYGPVEHHWKTQADSLRQELADVRMEAERLDGDVGMMEIRRAELTQARGLLGTAQTEVEITERALEGARRAAENAREKARLTQQAERLLTERERLDIQISTKAALEASLADRDDLSHSLLRLETEEREAAEISKKRAVAEANLRAARATVAETSGAGRPKAEEARRLTDRARDLEERMISIKSTETPICDRCGQAIADEALLSTLSQLETELTEAITRKATVIGEVEELRTRFGEQEAGVKALENELADLPASTFSTAALQGVKDKLSLLDAIPSRLATIEAAEMRRADLEGEIHDLELQGVSAGQQIDPQAFEAELTRFQELLETRRRELSEHERAIARHEEAISLLGKSQDRLAVIRKESSGREEALADAELLRKAFSKWGIPSLIIGNVLLALEREVNELLALYDGGLAVRFESERETGNGSRDSLEILVYEGQDWRSFETFSGGERYRVASAMRLGLALLLASRSGARVETLIVDEPEGLDVEGRQHLARILEHLSSHFGLTLLLTHYEDLKDAMPSQVLVTRGDDGLSKVEVVT
jgi:exonuclease SbcC